jgi:stage III sporulation protein AG
MNEQMNEAVNTENADRKNEGKSKRLLSRFFKLETKKKIQYMAILLLIVVILAIYFATAGGNAKKQQDNGATGAAPAVDTSGNTMEEQLKRTLSQIDGAGRVEVMITYESSSEIVPAISVDKQTSTTTQSGDSGTSTTNTENTQSEVVTIGGSNGNSALVIKENSPEIRGVIVVAQGADDIFVKLNLLKAVQTLLKVSPDQVDVYKMNNE